MATLPKDLINLADTRSAGGCCASRQNSGTNTVEGYFSIFKRGMKGVYQHCGEKHLHRYLAEFDFRYYYRSALGCEDGERALRALNGIKGKRLTYRWPNENSLTQ
jgi:hypothetical protein